MRAWLAVLLLALPAAAVDPIPEPTSFAKPVPGGRFLLVQLGNAAAENKFAGRVDQARFAELRAKFPRPGLYTNTTPAELVWPLPDDVFAPYDHVFPHPDGVHCVRIEGEFWKTEAFTGGRVRPSAADQAAQIDGPAVSFLKNGELIRQYSVRDLIQKPDELAATPQHLLWYASARLQIDTNRFNLFTQESIRHTFDSTTGELVATTPVGLANPRMQQILLACGVGSVGILLGWLVFIRKSRLQPR